MKQFKFSFRVYLLQVSKMGDPLRETLKLNIESILPHITEEKSSGLIEFLIKKGVKKEMDLRRLTITALEDHLSDLVDASDLHEEWQKCYGSFITSTFSIFTRSLAHIYLYR